MFGREDDQTDYICMGGVDWWYKSRAHSEVQLMRRVAKNRRVVFVNSIGLRMPIPGRTTQPLARIVDKAKSVSKFLRRPVPELRRFWVMSPLSLPFYGSEAGRRLNRWLVRAQLVAVCRVLRIDRPVYVVTLPTGWDVVRTLPRRALIVNKADKYSTLPDVDRAFIGSLEQDLLKHADRVLYVSRALMDEDAAAVDGRSIFLDHGVDLEHFTPRPPAEIPVDLAAIPSPRIGYFGNLADYRVDFDLLERLAQELPDVQIVLVGDATCSMDRFDRYPNVHWLGSRPYEEIPAYGSGLDVALMPYPNNEWTRYINPIKLKEYLALGLPVVSSDVPEARLYRDWLLLATTPAEFVAKVRQALAGQTPSSPAERRAAVMPYSWDGRAEELMRVAESVGEP
jgi:glycosyltransferase involved in cell wall biosynthesis